MSGTNTTVVIVVVVVAAAAATVGVAIGRQAGSTDCDSYREGSRSEMTSHTEIASRLVTRRE